MKLFMKLRERPIGAEMGALLLAASAGQRIMFIDPQGEYARLKALQDLPDRLQWPPRP